MNIARQPETRRIIDGTQEGRNILTILEQKDTFNVFPLYPFRNISIQPTGKCIDLLQFTQ